MNGKTSTELRADLRRLQAIDRIGYGKKDELHRGIARVEAELARREALLRRNPMLNVTLRIKGLRFDQRAALRRLPIWTERPSLTESVLRGRTEASQDRLIGLVTSIAPHVPVIIDPSSPHGPQETAN